jgi:hypothetical protein
MFFLTKTIFIPGAFLARPTATERVTERFYYIN